jgi:hypothetical protein
MLVVGGMRREKSLTTDDIFMKIIFCEVQECTPLGCTPYMVGLPLGILTGGCDWGLRMIPPG